MRRPSKDELLKRTAENFGLSLHLLKFLSAQRQLSPKLDQPADNILLHFLRDVSRKREFVRLLLSWYPKKIRQQLIIGPGLTEVEHYVFTRYKEAEGSPIPIQRMLGDLRHKFNLCATKKTKNMVEKMRKKAHDQLYYERKLIAKYAPPENASDDDLGKF